MKQKKCDFCNQKRPWNEGYKHNKESYRGWEQIEGAWVCRYCVAKSKKELKK